MKRKSEGLTKRITERKEIFHRWRNRKTSSFFFSFFFSAFSSTGTRAALSLACTSVMRSASKPRTTLSEKRQRKRKTGFAVCFVFVASPLRHFLVLFQSHKPHNSFHRPQQNITTDVTTWSAALRKAPMLPKQGFFTPLFKTHTLCEFPWACFQRRFPCCSPASQNSCRYSLQYVLVDGLAKFPSVFCR